MPLEQNYFKIKFNLQTSKHSEAVKLNQEIDQIQQNLEVCDYFGLTFKIPQANKLTLYLENPS